MSRKFLGFGLVYSLLLIGLTAFAVNKMQQSTAADAITQLEHQFREAPLAKRADVQKAIAAADRLDGALFEHDVLAHAEEGLQLHEDSQKLMTETHAIIASMQKLKLDLDDTCPACGGGECKCDGECTCPLKRGIPDELEPPQVITIGYERGIVPLPPRQDF